jgi:uncharacterized protein (DUF697 family)
VARGKLPIGPLAVYGLLKELRVSATDERALAVGGARELAGVLRRELSGGAAPGAVRDASVLEGAAVLVYVLAGPPGDEDERTLRRAHVARVPIVAVLAGPAGDRPIPHVLATDLVAVPPGSGFPVDDIARAVARRLGEKGAPLAARVPALRPAVCAELIRSFSRKNAIIAAAVWVPGADLPALTLNQVRLVLRIGSAYGFEIDRQRLPEVLGVVATGLGFRALARELLDLVPVAGWALKGALAYTATRAVGEAAVRYFATRQQGAASRAAP